MRPLCCGHYALTVTKGDPSTRPQIAVTRDEPPEGELSTALRQVGLEPLWCPVVQRRVIADLRPLLERLGTADWLVLTSAYAAEALAELPLRARVAVVGKATEAVARAKGWDVGLISPDGTGEGLFRALCAAIGGAAIVCYPRSSKAALPAPIHGVELLAPVIYETSARAFDRGQLHRADVVTFTSPSAVAEGAGPGLKRPAAIGPTTAAALRRHGQEPWLECRGADFEEFARAIAAKLGEAR
jgi:uroporphyrinogen-III synthase